MKTDPRVKLLLIVLLTTLAVLAKDVAWLGIVTGAALLVDILYGIDVFSAVRRLKHFLWILVFIALVQSLTIKGGKVLIHINDVNLLTVTGLRFAAEFILRMAVIVFAGLIAASADGREMADGLQKLGVPYVLTFMSSVAVRYIPVFREEFAARMNAIAMRGIDIKRLRIWKKMKVYAYLISPTVSGCILRSVDLARSMENRGFRADRKRTMYRELKMKPLDWVIAAVAIASASAYTFCMYYFGPLVVF